MIKCDACGDIAEWVAMTPRFSKNKAPRPPARFRLCSVHSDELGGNEPAARFLPMIPPEGER